MAIESDRASIAHRCGSDARDRASQHPSANRRAAMRRLEMQIDRGPWQQAVMGFDECAVRGHVDDRGFVPRTDPDGDDSVLLDATLSMRAPAIVTSMAHSGFHRRARASNFRDRKSTRLNSSHLGISYAVFCLKKKKR